MNFFATIVLLFSAYSFAGRHMAYLGGSGDPAGATTLFDHKIPAMASYANEGGYNVSVAFDGGHSNTEAVLQNNFRGIVSDFTPTAYESIIAGYERRIQDGDIKSGDQIMVVIDSHGGRRYGQSVTHNVASGRGQAVDLINLQNSQTVSLDRLQNLSRLAQQRNIRLAVLDFSCHSGASLPLANSHTCVIAASGPESFAYGGTNQNIFSNKISVNLRPGRNLEDAFLEARSSSTDLGFPMISTQAGLSVQDRLYPLLQRYLNFSQARSDKFRQEITDSVLTRSCEQENTDVQRIIELSQQIEATSAGLELSAFREALQNYQNYRQSVQEQLERAGVGRLREKRTFCGSPVGGCSEFQLEQIILMDPQRNITEFRNGLALARTPADRARSNQWIDYFTRINTFREEILRSYPDLRNYSTLLSSSPEVTRRTQELAGRVAVESRKLYSSLYQRARTPNACRDFIL